MIQGLDDLMTLKQVADYFKVSEITVHRLTQKGVIPAFKIGRQWRYHRNLIKQMVEQHSKNNLKSSPQLKRTAF